MFVVEFLAWMSPPVIVPVVVRLAPVTAPVVVRLAAVTAPALVAVNAVPAVILPAVAAILPVDTVRLLLNVCDAAL